MKRAAIVRPLRTPIGAFGGSLRGVPVEELGATVAREVIKRTGLDPARLDDVVFSQSPARGAGLRCRPAFRSTFRACNSTGAAAADCNPSSLQP